MDPLDPLDLVAKAMADVGTDKFVVLIEDPQTPQDRSAHGVFDVMDALAFADTMRQNFTLHDLHDCTISLIPLHISN